MGSTRHRPRHHGVARSERGGKDHLHRARARTTPARRGRAERAGADPASSGIDVRARIGYSPSTTTCRRTCTPPTSFGISANCTACLPGRRSRERTTRSGRSGSGRSAPPDRHDVDRQRQRVKLAGAIVHDPSSSSSTSQPTGSTRSSATTCSPRSGGRSEFGMDIVISSHHLEEAERICDAVVILGGGSVVPSDT